MSGMLRINNDRMIAVDKGYEVHGIIRHTSSFNTGGIDHLYQGPHGTRRKHIKNFGM